MVNYGFITEKFGLIVIRTLLCHDIGINCGQYIEIFCSIEIPMTLHLTIFFLVLRSILEPFKIC